MPSCKQTRRIEWALDAANFFLADVQGGLGPYLAVYLPTKRRWDEASIGVVMSIATAAGLLAQTPAAAQVVMVPMALLVGAKADAWGRKPLFLAGLAILPIRGVLYTLSDNSVWLVAVQLLDGVGAGIFGAISPSSSPTSCAAPAVSTPRRVRS